MNNSIYPRLLYVVLITLLVSVTVWLPFEAILLSKEGRRVSQFIEEDTLLFITKIRGRISDNGNIETLDNNPELFNLYVATPGDEVSLIKRNKDGIVEESVRSVNDAFFRVRLHRNKMSIVRGISMIERTFLNKEPVTSDIGVVAFKDKKSGNYYYEMATGFQHKGDTYTLTIKRNLEEVYSHFMRLDLDGITGMLTSIILSANITTTLLLFSALRKFRSLMIAQADIVAISHGDAPNLAENKGPCLKDSCDAFIRLGRRLDEANEKSISAMQDVSHAVASNLAEIKQAIDLIRYYGYQDDKAVESQMKRIENNSSRIREIHNTISSLAKLERSKTNIAPQVFHLQELINLAADVAQKHYPQFKIEHPVIGIPKYIFIQREHFLLIAEALIQNAVKYSNSDNKKIVIESMDGDTPKNKAGFSITNWGIGIPKDEESRIFERYYRGSNVTGEKSGVGLGLHMVYQILQLYDANIEVESVLKYNNVYRTTFKVIFPEFKEDYLT